MLNHKNRRIRYLEYTIKVRIFLLLGICAFFAGAGVHQAKETMLQLGIRRNVLRLHILANSDSGEDQSVKLLVRDELLDWLETELTEQEQNNLGQMESAIRIRLPEIKKRADKILQDQGFSYHAEVELGTGYFPEKTYGEYTFPAGEYTALRIFLGAAEGHNWWCVLFPRLCFADCIHAVFPEQGREQLKKILTEEEYESLFDPSKDAYRICFRYF